MKKIFLLFFTTTILAASIYAQGGDPWIKKVYNTTWGRDPSPMEYNIYNYHNGQWNSYEELMKYIYEFQKNINSARISFKYSQKVVNNQVIVGIFQNGTQIAADLITNDGGSIVAQGGGNIVAQGGGNIVAQGGGNIVAQGGGNIVVNSGTKGLAFGSASTRVLAGTGNAVIPTSGGSAWIIK